MRLVQLLEATVTIYIGSVHDGSVSGSKATFSTESDDIPTHAGMKLRGKRWRFPVKTDKVLWWELPDEEEKARVDDWLSKRGYHNLKHVRMNDSPSATMADIDVADYAHGYTHIMPSLLRRRRVSR